MVRMGIMAYTHESVQALHMDALCHKRLSADEHLKKSKGATSATDNHATVFLRCRDTPCWLAVT